MFPVHRCGSGQADSGTDLINTGRLKNPYAKTLNLSPSLESSGVNSSTGGPVKVDESLIMCKYKEKERKEPKFFSLYVDGTGPFIVNDRVVAVGSIVLGKTVDPEHEILWSFKAEDFKNALSFTADAFHRQKPGSFMKKQIDNIFVIQRRQMYDPSNEGVWTTSAKSGRRFPSMTLAFNFDLTDSIDHIGNFKSVIGSYEAVVKHIHFMINTDTFVDCYRNCIRLNKGLSALWERIKDPSDNTWQSIKVCPLVMNHPVTLDKYMMDDDIVNTMKSLGYGEPHTWQKKVVEMCFKNGELPGRFAVGH